MSVLVSNGGYYIKLSVLVSVGEWRLLYNTKPVLGRDPVCVGE